MRPFKMPLFGAKRCIRHLRVTQRNLAQNMPCYLSDNHTVALGIYALHPFGQLCPLLISQGALFALPELHIQPGIRRYELNQLLRCQPEQLPIGVGARDRRMAQPAQHPGVLVVGYVQGPQRFIIVLTDMGRCVVIRDTVAPVAALCRFAPVGVKLSLCHSLIPLV